MDFVKVSHQQSRLDTSAQIQKKALSYDLLQAQVFGNAAQRQVHKPAGIAASDMSVALHCGSRRTGP